MNNVTPATTQTVLAARDLVRSFTDGTGSPVPVLNGVSFDIARGEIVAVVGSSGSGKSTLLQILGGLDACDGGSVSIDGQNLQKLSEREICTLRNEKLGFVYQFHHLLPEFTALENVAMPLVIARIPEKEAHERARAALEALGLGHRLTHLPSQLSGGERQRTAMPAPWSPTPPAFLPMSRRETSIMKRPWTCSKRLSRAPAAAAARSSSSPMMRRLPPGATAFCGLPKGALRLKRPSDDT